VPTEIKRALKRKREREKEREKEREREERGREALKKEEGAWKKPWLSHSWGRRSEGRRRVIVPDFGDQQWSHPKRPPRDSSIWPISDCILFSTVTLTCGHCTAAVLTAAVKVTIFLLDAPISASYVVMHNVNSAMEKPADLILFDSALAL
jgi:hypothetical protein